MVKKSDVGVWMDNEDRFESVARMIAIDCMAALGMDHVHDFRTRDKIIAAISPRVQRTLDDVSRCYRYPMKSIDVPDVARCRQEIVAWMKSNGISYRQLSRIFLYAVRGYYAKAARNEEQR